MSKHEFIRTVLSITIIVHLTLLASFLQANTKVDEQIDEAETVVRHTFSERHFEEIVRQQTDYSCGAATMATLMTYYFNDEITEREVLDTLIAGLSDSEIKDREFAGFSLLDLKRAAQELGYRAAGYRLTVEQLRKINAPVVVHVDPKGYEHFALLRMIVGDRVFLADPSRGNLRMSLERFENEWGGVVFILEKNSEDGSYNDEFGSFVKRDTLVNKIRWYRQIERMNPFDSGPSIFQQQQQ